VTSALGLFLGAAILGWWWRQAPPAPMPSAQPRPAAASASSPHPVRRRSGGLDVTFLVAADMHVGWGAVEASTADSDHHPAPIDVVNRRLIQDMNRMAGRSYPPVLGGVVARPLGLLIAGDLTEHGSESDWAKFRSYFGLDGRDGPPRLPVFEGIGNHDQAPGDFVAQQVAARHGSDFYSWDWGDLHLVCLGIAPDPRGLGWLEQDLARIGPELPLVLYLHYPLAGPYADTWFSREGYRAKLADLLRRYNVVAIFHGHFHATGTYRWEGKDVYFVGSPKDPWRSFAVVHVTDTTLGVSSWNYDLHAWWWWHQKSINGATREAILGERVPPGFEPSPLIESESR
jgi:3',5'-cyclic AMP phosphodiesterase CpdA